jgi:hypothetical protein
MMPTVALQPMTMEFWLRFFSQNPPQPGNCDIICVGRDSEYKRLLNLLMVLFYAIHDGAGRSPFGHIRIIIPPGGKSAADAKSQLLSRMCNILEEHRGQAVSADEIAALDGAIAIDTAPDLEAASVLEVLRQMAPKGVAIIVEAARYSGRHHAESPRSGRSRRPEDSWVSHLNALVRGAVEAGTQRDCYVLVDAGEFGPLESDNQELLKSIDASAFWAGGPLAEAEARSLQSGVGAAERQMAQGLVGEAFAVVARIDGMSEDQRLLLKVQLLKNQGRVAEALALIKPELERLLSHLDGQSLVALASLAVEGEHPVLAERLLSQALASLEREDSLAAALALATRLGVPAAETELESRLSTLFPRSPALLSRRIARALGDRDYSTVLALVDCMPTAEFPAELLEFYTHVARVLTVEGEPDYSTLLTIVGERTPKYAKRARVIAARDARARGLLFKAVALAVEIDTHGPGAARIADVAIGAIEELLIGRDAEGKPVASVEEVQTSIGRVIEYLSDNPSAAGNRNALARVLSVEVCGSTGLALLAGLSLNLAALPVDVLPESAPVHRPRLDVECVRSFMRGTLKYFAERSPIIIGKGVFPEELLTADADSLLEEVTELLDVASGNLLSEPDRQVALQILHIAVLLARKSEKPFLELTLVRLVAGKLAAVGHGQRARDLAEGVLQEVEASASSARKRQAWFTFADIYHRTNNRHEALLALACALSQRGARVLQEQVWHETFLLARLLRDLDLTDLSLQVVAWGRLILKRMGLDARYGHRLDFVERTIALRELLREPAAAPSAPDAWMSLLAGITGDCRAALEKLDESAPAAMLLGQAILHCRVRGIVIDDATRSAFEGILGRVAEPMASRIRTLSLETPSVEDVTSLVHALDETRYSEDIGFDVRAVVLAARRLLVSNAAIESPAVAAFAIELLSDQTVRIPRTGDIDDRATLTTPSEPEDVAQFAREVSLDGLTLHMLAFDARDRLCRISIEGGLMSGMVTEPAMVFSRQRFDAWRREYPAKYSELDTTGAVISNTFWESVRGLGISHSAAPGSRVLVVAETLLQQIPPNVLLVGAGPHEESLAGTQLAIASVPSLNWLRGARLGPRSRSGRRLAWISTVTRDRAGRGTLDMVARRLTDTLEAHGIVLHTGAEPPEDLGGSDLVIVGAHGTLSPEGRYFQVAADEGTLRMTARRLAAHLAGASVVILFVCSAARADSHPLSSATVGLPRLLLESGVRVVVASPWPLDSQVPSHWLPAFLEASRKGLPVIDSNFVANQAVKRAMGDRPSHVLAMTVVGDPLVLAAAGP